MTVIVVVFVIASLGLWLARRIEPESYWTSRLLILAIWLLLICFVGMRSWNIGRDSLMYARRFESFGLQKLTIRDYLAPGYTLIILLLKAMGLAQYQYLFIVMAALTFAFLLIGVWKLSRMPAVTFFIILSYGNMIEATNQYRQFLAISIVLFAFSFLKNHEIGLYYVFIVLACCFHPTALICLLIPLLLRWHPEYKAMLILVIVAVPFFFLLRPFLHWVMSQLPYVKYYVGSEFDSGISLKGIALFIIRIVIFVFVLAGLKRIGEEESSETGINIFFYGLILQAMAVVLPVLARLPFYYVQISAVLIPETMVDQSYKNDEQMLLWNKTILRNVLVIFFFLLYLLADCYSKRYMWTNYSFFWQESHSLDSIPIWTPK